MTNQAAKQVSTAEAKLGVLVQAASDHLAAGETDELLSTLRAILDIDPNHAVGLYHLGMLCEQKRQYEEAIPALTRVLEMLPELTGARNEFFSACHAFSRALVALGRGNEAELALETLRASVPDTDKTREIFAKIHFNIAIQFQSANQAEPCIRQYRKALALSPGMQGAATNLGHMLAATGQRALLADYTATIKPHELSPYLFIACMPKSGSSFLKTALCALTGYPECGLTYSYMQNEQELYLPQVLDTATKAIVTQQHCRATEANLQIMQGFGIRPIVLIRDLPDILSSLYDFYEAGATSNTFFAPYWPNLSPSERVDLIVDHVVPWYLAFYASWVAAERAGRLEMLWMRYQDMIADKPAALARVARFYGIDAPPVKVASSIAAAEGDRGATRFNKGVVGRGLALLTAEQRARMVRLASAYRGLDFSPIGL